MATGAAEGLLIQAILVEITNSKAKVVILTDSQSAKAAAGRAGLGRMKHMEIKYLYWPQLVETGRVQLKRVWTRDNVADLLTKFVDAQTLTVLVKKFDFNMDW